jgi:hypothetical protein
MMRYPRETVPVVEVVQASIAVAGVPLTAKISHVPLAL